jgi:hypothetical protein
MPEQRCTGSNCKQARVFFESQVGFSVFPTCLELECTSLGLELFVDEDVTKPFTKLYSSDGVPSSNVHYSIRFKGVERFLSYVLVLTLRHVR